jgi:hypothetical protein
MQLCYHHTESLIWYVLFLIIPLCFGFLLALGLIPLNIFKGIKIICYIVLVIQLFFHLSAGFLFSYYWGYIFKRPAIFLEVTRAKKVITCSNVLLDPYGKNELVYSREHFSHDSLYGRKDPYEGGLDRVFMTFQDNTRHYPDLYDFPIESSDSTQKISDELLKEIAAMIYKSGILDRGEPGWDMSMKLKGYIVDFITAHDERFVYAGLKGGQVENDHYPFYEFLFKQEQGNFKLIHKQIYYYDVAGAEGFEYSIISPLFSLFLTVITSILIGIILLRHLLLYLFCTKKGLDAC